MSYASLDSAVTAIAGLWEPSTFPAFDSGNEYLRGQLELVVDTFPFPFGDREKWEDNQKEYVYDLVAEKLGLKKGFRIPEELETEWDIIVNLHQGMTAEDFDREDNSYTYGQLEYFVVTARRIFGFDDITGNDIPALKERLAKDARIS